MDQQYSREASGISLLAKNEEQSTKGIVYAVMVETYALLAFVISMIMVLLGVQ